MVLTDEDIQAISNLINNAITPLRKDIVSLKQDFSTMKKEFGKLSDRVTSIEKYIKIDSVGIEDELNKAIIEHLPQRFPGFTITPFTLKYLHDPTSKKLITELDGAFLIKHVPEASSTLPEHRFLVIVEAKHHVDYTRIIQKMQQMYYIKQYINASKTMQTDQSYTKKFIDSVNAYKIDKIEDIYLYIGGPTWETGMVKYVKMLNDANPRVFDEHRLHLDKITKEQFIEIVQQMKGHIGSIVPKGVRYVINDMSKYMVGGNNNQRKLRQYASKTMDIMPNHINMVYT